MNWRENTALLLLALAVTSAACASGTVLVIHGGAGALPRAELSVEREAAIRADLEAALRAGHAILKSGGSALDAVVAPLVILEDSEQFNAGHGAVLNHEGNAELDASIMDGAMRRAGAVGGLHRVKNPIKLARAVMDHSKHVMMIGDGAERFARSQALEMVDPSYFVTERRKRDLEKAQQAEKSKRSALDPRWMMGTVGAVALDANGRLAAATSTGGMTNKRYGRLGDTPIIGAGTWADANCAVSGTGWGEFFIRGAVAHDICARLAYRRDPIGKAANDVLAELKAAGGDGGVIVLDGKGNFAMPFNTGGMYRGSIDDDGKVTIAVYAE